MILAALALSVPLLITPASEQFNRDPMDETRQTAQERQRARLTGQYPRPKPRQIQPSATSSGAGQKQQSIPQQRPRCYTNAAITLSCD